ncbi:MAG: hypothetical protein GXP23_10300 [Gammaproteobacteria bacterium]|nr:hypothetical protein [Gammaproteobacteria bacterium]
MSFQSVRDGVYAIWSHLWTAYDVARMARRDEAPDLVDLLAGGKRKGFLESADTFYAIGFINIQRGAVYRIVLPDTKSFYTAVSLHSSRQQSSIEIFKEESGEESGVMTLLLGDSVAHSEGLDTAAYHGITQLMVRQYYVSDRMVSSTQMPTLEVLSPPPMAAMKSKYQVSIAVGMQFFYWRLKLLLGTKYIQFRIRRAGQRNRFYSQEDASSLLPSVKASVSRLGMAKYRYLLCMFDIHENEMLRIDYQPKDDGYFAFCLHNNWMQNIRGGGESEHLNSHQLEERSEGGYSIYVGGCNYGNKTNYLNTSGYTRGVIAFREIAPAEGAEIPGCRLITTEGCIKS